MKYIESTPLPDGTYDHTEVRAACRKGYSLEVFSKYYPFFWLDAAFTEFFARDYKYRAQVPDTYGIHESSSTLREVKGDAGPAVAEMLLDRIKELEAALEAFTTIRCLEDLDWLLPQARAALNKEPK